MAPIPPLPAEDHACGPCGTDFASLGVDAAVDTIRNVPDRLASAVRALEEATLRRRPDARTWSVLEYACHIRDVYAAYTIRLYRTRVEDRPSLEPMLNDLRAVRFKYNRREIAAVLAEVSDNVEGFIEETTGFAETDWDRRASRLPGEERTARWLVRQAMHEGIHHLGDITAVVQRLRAKEGTEGRSPED